MIDYPHRLGADMSASSAPPPVVRTQFAIGDVVRHQIFDFRGVIFDVDPVFANDEEWYQSIPEHVRPDRDQPFYHLLAEGDEGSYTAYVSQGNLVLDPDAGPIQHPEIKALFERFSDGRYALKAIYKH